MVGFGSNSLPFSSGRFSRKKVRIVMELCSFISFSKLSQSYTISCPPCGKFFYISFIVIYGRKSVFLRPGFLSMYLPILISISVYFLTLIYILAFALPVLATHIPSENWSLEPSVFTQVYICYIILICVCVCPANCMAIQPAAVQAIGYLVISQGQT